MQQPKMGLPPTSRELPQHSIRSQPTPPRRPGPCWGEGWFPPSAPSQVRIRLPRPRVKPGVLCPARQAAHTHHPGPGKTSQPACAARRFSSLGWLLGPERASATPARTPWRATGSPPAQMLLAFPLLSPPQSVLVSLLLLFSHSFLKE